MDLTPAPNTGLGAAIHPHHTPQPFLQGSAGPKSLLPLAQGHSQAGERCPPPQRVSGLLFAHTNSQITVKSSLALRAGFACARGLSVATRARHRALAAVPGRATEVSAALASGRGSKTSRNLSEPQVHNGWDWERPRELREHGDGAGGSRGHSADTLPFSPRHRRAEPPPSPGAMDEWDLPQWKKEVESLKYQLAYKREMSSKTIPE